MFDGWTKSRRGRFRILVFPTIGFPLVAWALVVIFDGQTEFFLTSTVLLIWGVYAVLLVSAGIRDLGKRDEGD